MGPVLVREIEGVVFRASLPTAVSPLPTFVRVSEGDEENPTAETQADESADAPVAGIILSSSGFSTQALLQVRSSSVPLAAMHVLAQPADGNGADEKLMQRCVSIIWNDRFGSSTGGLLEGGMEVRWGREFGGNSGAPGRPVIYRGGRPLR
ncbi:uncharacterized protein MEPE_00053 [Melanopsichium pennsylvanicum]|uniref:Uncharacterized protein n=2 Tax=Melanopsichium pennsylvanicum TaxID=63383 RepID=A0AAJ4XFU0_9BASI|nr:conserved hypothetical protein [Melanopsichium pennsylvanicum 4]SNX81348.1 uncharacterized protein MEPE_00053 [Melanopsichium pennsylvanicum]